MAMCKECGSVVGAMDIQNGICTMCIENGVIAEPEVNNPVIKKDMPLVNYGNPFSFKNRSGRMDYLVYGTLLPYSLFGLYVYVSLMLKIGSSLLPLVLLFSLFIAIAATVRRIRDTQNSVMLIVILSLIPYVNFITMLYLLFVPSKYSKK